MTWSNFFLICFIIGFGFSFISFFMGLIDIPHVDLSHFHLDMDGFHLHHGDMGGHGGEIGPLNGFTIAAFLTWFGGAGYILSNYSAVALVVALLLSGLSGLVGASLVFLFLVKFLLRGEGKMNAADYDMVGVLGKVSSPIRRDGIGEIIFSRLGSRCHSPARSDLGEAISEGTEVVVTRYETGTAWVKPWDDLDLRQE